MYLLDTHIVLFAADVPEKLKTQVREILVAKSLSMPEISSPLWRIANLYAPSQSGDQARQSMKFLNGQWWEFLGQTALD